MKFNKIKYVIAILVVMQVFTSCKKSFLELTPRGTILESNFYKTDEEIYQGLIAVYDVIQWGTTGGYTMKMPLLSAGSDDCYAGGSSPSDQPNWVAFDNFKMDGRLGPQGGLWGKNYTGINRANLLLTKIDLNTSMNADFKKRVIAETKFLRAYFYFDLVRLFGSVPLILKVLGNGEYDNQKQESAPAIYAQIEKDLRESAPDLPVSVPNGEKGRISMGAARALLGKVLLYTNDNTKIAEAAVIFREVNDPAKYGYRLLDKFADVFDPTNKFSAESILEIPHSNNAAWGNWGFVNGGEGNVAPQFVGADSYTGPFYSNGWGFCPVTEDLANFMKGDPRFAATIIDGKDLIAEGAKYTARFQNTDYFIKKYAPLSSVRSTTGTAELNWPINEVEIRVADTYLMEAEALIRTGGDAGRALDLLDKVRGRVGLGSVPVTLDNIFKERRMELATEGHRFFDLVRSNRAAAALGSSGFVVGKNEVLPIPVREIELTKGLIKQNPGYN